MAASQLIATGTGPADSSEITIVAGDMVAVAIKGGSGDAVVGVYLKDDEGGFNRILDLVRGNGYPLPSTGTVLSVPGVYRLTRQAGNCGAFRG